MNLKEEITSFLLGQITGKDEMKEMAELLAKLNTNMFEEVYPEYDMLGVYNRYPEEVEKECERTLHAMGRGKEDLKEYEVGDQFSDKSKRAVASFAVDALILSFTNFLRKVVPTFNYMFTTAKKSPSDRPI